MNQSNLPEAPPPYKTGLPDNSLHSNLASPAYQSQQGYVAQPGYPQQGYVTQPGYQQQHVHVGQIAQPVYQPGYTVPINPSTVHVVQGGVGHTFMTPITFLPYPMNMTCPSCQAQIMTSIRQENGTLTYLLCAILILLGCWLGCCMIPFCLPECQDIVHGCPACQSAIGIYKRIH